MTSKPHSEPFKLLRDLIEVMDACTENECDKCHADAKTMLEALTGLEEQLEAFRHVLVEIADIPKDWPSLTAVSMARAALSANEPESA